MCGTNYDRDAKVVFAKSVSKLKAACLSGVILRRWTPVLGAWKLRGLRGVAWATWPSVRRRDSRCATRPPAADRLLQRQGPRTRRGVASTPLDWTTYRADNSRSGSSVGHGAAVQPACSGPGPPILPSTTRPKLMRAWRRNPRKPICVGDRVYFGTAAGIHPLPGSQDRKGIMELSDCRAHHLRADILGRQALRRLGRRPRVLSECRGRQPAVAVPRRADGTADHGLMVI